jgi:hypothetical protein
MMQVVSTLALGLIKKELMKTKFVIKFYIFSKKTSFIFGQPQGYSGTVLIFHHIQTYEHQNIYA